MEVAIKEAHSKDAKEEMLEEAKSMIKVSKHDHIVNFQGVCVENDSVYLLLEFCSLGPIENFLQLHREEFISKLENNDSKELIQWCAQVADGMEFLASKNIIHVSQIKEAFFTNIFQLPKKANNNASNKDVLSTLEFRART